MDRYGRKSGGRKKGVGNRNDAIKPWLRQHSMAYYMPGENGRSRFDEDIEQLTPKERAEIEVKLLRYHTAEIKAIDAQIAAVDERRDSVLARLSDAIDGLADDEPEEGEES